MRDEPPNENEIKRLQKILDHEVIQMQYCLLKIFTYCSDDLLQNDQLISYVDELVYESVRMLNHEHHWVRCNAAKIISHVIEKLDFEWLSCKLSNHGRVKDKPQSASALKFMYDNPHYDIKTLILDLCAQSVPGQTSQLMIDEIWKIFLYVANILKAVKMLEGDKKSIVGESTSPESISDDESNVDETKDEICFQNTKPVNLVWLIHRLRFLTYGEVSKAIHCTKMVNYFIFLLLTI